MQICWNILLKWRKMSFTTVQKKNTSHLTEWFVHFRRQLTKYYYRCIEAAYNTEPIISDNQTLIDLSAKNKVFYWNFLQKMLKLSAFPVPKDPCSKVMTFPGNKEPWEPCHEKGPLLWFYIGKYDNSTTPYMSIILAWFEILLYPALLL